MSKGYFYFFIDFSTFFHRSTTPVGLGLLYEVSRSDSDILHMVGFLWMSDWTVAVISIYLLLFLCTLQLLLAE
jgi:hypothetical protein